MTVKSQPRHFWTDADNAAMREMYADTSNEVLCARFGRTVYAVQQRALVLGLRKSAAYCVYALAARRPRPPTRRLQMLAQATPLLDRPTGASLHEIQAASGANMVHVKSMLYLSSKAGDLHVVGMWKSSRYFLTARAATAGALLIAAELEKSRIAAKAAKNAKRRTGKSERLIDKQAAKAAERQAICERKAQRAVVKAAKRKPAPKVVMLRPSPKKAPEDRRRAAWDAAEPRITSQTKVTICPGYTGAPRWASVV